MAFCSIKGTGILCVSATCVLCQAIPTMVLVYVRVCNVLFSSSSFHAMICMD